MKAYIFVWTELNNFAKFVICTKSAVEWAEEIKQQLEDKEALDIDDIKVLIDLSKAETIKEVQHIKASSVKHAEEQKCKIAHIFVTIGYRLFDIDSKG